MSRPILTKQLLAVLVLGSLSVSSSATASVTVSATYVGRGSNPAPASQALTYPGGSNNTSNGGQFEWVVSGAGWSPAPVALRTSSGTFSTTNFVAFCLEISQPISLNNQYNYSLDPLTTAPKPNNVHGSPISAIGADRISKLWAAQFPTLFTGSNVSNQVAAFQLAIWELVYDDGAGAPNLLTGNLQVAAIGGANSVTGMAQAWLTAIYNAEQNNVELPRANLMALTSMSNQDQLVEVVPEPASIAVWSVLAGGAAGLSLAKRRRRKSASGRWDDETRSAIFAVVENGKAHH